MLVQPKLGGRSGNPLLDVDASLSTTSSIVIQTLSAPEVAKDIKDSTGCTYKITKSGSVVGADPFIFVSARCEAAASESAGIVNYVLGRASETLVNYQRSLQVAPSRNIRLQPIVGALPPQYAIISRQTATAGVAVLLGIAITVTMILLCERRARQDNYDLLRGRETLPPPVGATIPSSRTFAVGADSIIDDEIDHAPSNGGAPLDRGNNISTRH
jgi:hypothetical protein